ncbi:beta-galactosidase [Frateuria sp. YIM B11624]|uniref:beta-galactosidase n=1 Tax=Frateuria sp. YIM B11624 TaxID=3143185 RepID=UPI003C70C0CD
MQRRTFLRLSLLAPMLAASGVRLEAMPGTAFAATVPDGRPHRFALGRRQFLLDGQPFQIRSGEMHPVRIPSAYWRQRIRMARAMGLNTIAIYLMWNALEPAPGRFDFEGRNDIARFIALCAEEGMWVYLRPGPYVCAEWDFGGLPPWLLHEPDIRVRDRHDRRYMDAVARYLDAVAPRVAPLMVAHGGPILMVQVENEYASFGKDREYLETLRRMWIERGIEGPFSVSDGLGQIREARTYLEGAALGLDGDTDFAGGQAIAGKAPVWVGEGYPGWLTHWGEPGFQHGDYLSTLRRLLADGRSFNLYVVHGGTNFGFGAGANAKGDGSDFQPVITSYDYGAPIDERGAPTADYHHFRAAIGTSLGRRLPALPPAPAGMRFPDVTPEPIASLWDALPAPVAAGRPQSMETLLGQLHGLVLYRTHIDVPHGGRLRLEGVSDYATVFVDGRYLGHVSRLRHAGLHSDGRIALPPTKGRAMLDILVDSFGHVGYGAFMRDRKGLLGEAWLDGRPLRGWQIHGLPLDAAHLASVRAARASIVRPGRFFRARVTLDRVGDTYLDMRGWNKGYLWLNGRLLGRYWHIGPQQRLFCPGCWMRKGDNELLVLDLHRMQPATIVGADRLQG